MALTPLPARYDEARTVLQVVAAQLLARRRFALDGHIGLRPTPGGFGTLAAGPHAEVVRVAGTWLLRERTGSPSVTDVLDLRSTDWQTAADWVEVDLTAAVELGGDAPEVGDPGAVIGLDPAAAATVAEWLSLGGQALDTVVAERGGTDGSVVQLWPEHFDAGCDVATASGRANLGASTGDGFHPEPYLYVGPHSRERPGDTGFWNAPFGAVVGHSEIAVAVDPIGAMVEFLHQGLGLLDDQRG